MLRRNILLTLAMFLGVMVLGQSAYATTCTKPNDWIPIICDSEDWGSYAPEGSRCWDNTATRAQMITGCTNEAVGCAELGGCFGPNPVGHWVVTVVNNKQVRCRCGCWTKDTEFASTGGNVSGSRIIAGGEAQDGQFSLTTFDAVHNAEGGDLPVNGVVYGLEKEAIYKFGTDANRSFRVTAAHPVPIADKDGQLSVVKTADQLKVGDSVLGSDGKVQAITTLEREAYSGQVVNFNVKSDNALQHFVSANGVIMGDNAWQQALASRDARRLARADIVRSLMGK